MSEEGRPGTLFLPVNGAYSGNLLWPGDLPEALGARLDAALPALRRKGYFASPFPEGDGVTFRRNDGAADDAHQALADFRAALPFLAIAPLGPGETQAQALARLAEARTITCTYLAPVEGLQLEETLILGKTRILPPVDGARHRLADHPWRALCEEVGADVQPDWTPRRDAAGAEQLLAYPLIERTIEVPLGLVLKAHGRVQDGERLLRLLMEDADQALDPVRFAACHYRRLEYLPAKPGWIGEFAVIHLAPASPATPARLLAAKPYVLRVANTWLGLQVDAGALSPDDPMAWLVDASAGDEITLALKAALRAWNRAFYLVDLEASFLHLVYALDGLCDPGRLTGPPHRLWICALASDGDPAQFERLLPAFDALYDLRNDLVHRGRTFASMGQAGEEACQFMLELLGASLVALLRRSFTTRRQVKDFAFATLTDPALAAAIATWGKVKTAPSQDKDLTRHVRP